MPNQRPAATVFNELRDFVPPQSAGSVDIDPDVISDPFREAIAYASPLSLDEAEEWYDTRFRISLVSRSQFDRGQRTITFESDASDRIVRASLFDVTVPDGLGATTCFSGFMGLEQLVASSPRLVGLLQLEDFKETIARMKANGEWPPD